MLEADPAIIEQDERVILAVMRSAFAAAADDGGMIKRAWIREKKDKFHLTPFSSTYFPAGLSTWSMD